MSAANSDTHVFGGPLNTCYRCGMDKPGASDVWVPRCEDLQEAFGDLDNELEADAHHEERPKSTFARYDLQPEEEL